MVWLLLTLDLLTSVWTFPAEAPPTYRTEEDDNVTFRWDIWPKIHISVANILCIFLSEPAKVVYTMIKSLEYPELYHEHFAGRVRLDKDALGDGRFRLHLSSVTVEDSGNYKCDLAANYENSKRRWELEASENFVVEVSQATGGDNRDVSVNTNTSGPGRTEGSEHKRKDQLKDYVLLAGFIGTLLVVTAVAYGKVLWIGTKVQKQTEDTGPGSCAISFL